MGILQTILENKRPLVTYSRLGGQNGLRMSRAAFGVMIKFSDLIDTIQNAVDEIEIMWPELEGDS